MSNRLPFAKPSNNGRTDRLDDQLKLWDKVAEEAKGTSGVFILGDLFDQSRVDGITLTETTGCLRKPAEETYVYILPGNHDAVNHIKGGRFTVEAYGRLNHERIRYLRTPESVFGLPDWLRFWPFAFGSIEDTQRRLRVANAKVEADPNRLHVNLIHNSVMGCSHEGWLCDDGLTPEEARGLFHYTLAGHFHTHQRFGADQKGMYCGAPLHWRFDDANRKAGFWKIKFYRSGKVVCKFIDSGLPKFHKYDWDLIKDDLDVERFGKPGDYVRIIVSATHAQYVLIKADVCKFIEKMNEFGLRALAPQFKPQYHHTERIVRKTDGVGQSIELNSMIFRYVRAANVDTINLDKKKLVELGRKALASVRAG